MERLPDVREPLARVPPLREELLVLARELRVERADPLAAVSAARNLSKSLSACLLVLTTSRRSVRSAEVTSL